MITIDATGKKLGRVASEAASYLMGKKTVSFARNKVTDVKVNITNTSKADINEKKLSSTEYVTFTGFRGGIYSEKMSEIVAKKGFKEVFERAVYGMLPKNKLTKAMMKNLNITE